MRTIPAAVRVVLCAGTVFVLSAACSRAPSLPILKVQKNSISPALLDGEEHALVVWMREQSGVRLRLGNRADSVFRAIDRARERGIENVLERYRRGNRRTADLLPHTDAGANGIWAPKVTPVVSVSRSRLVLASLSEQGDANGSSPFSGLGLALGACVSLFDAPRDKQGNVDVPAFENSQELENGVSMTATLRPKVTGSRFEGEADILLAKKDAGYEEKSAATIRMDLCPDASGNVRLDLSLRSAVSAGVGMQYTLESQATGHVNDEANLTDIDVQGGANGALQPRDGGNNQYVEYNYGYNLDGNGSTMEMRNTRLDTTRQSSQITQSFARQAAGMASAMTSYAAMVAFTIAEHQWQKGYCVALAVPAMGSPPKRAVPVNSQTPFTAVVRHKFEGSELNGPATATLVSGALSVSPSSTRTPTPARFVYKAPAKSGSAATVRLESRSKRGVGTLEVTFTTGGYKVDGPFGDGHVSGIVCSLDRAFSLEFDTPVGLVGTFTFVPSGASNGGTWTYLGHFQNVVKNTGNGNYSIEGVAEGQPRIVILAGSRWTTTTPVASANEVGKKETLALQPAECSQ